WSVDGGLVRPARSQTAAETTTSTATAATTAPRTTRSNGDSTTIAPASPACATRYQHRRKPTRLCSRKHDATSQAEPARHAVVATSRRTVIRRRDDRAGAAPARGP